MCGISLRRQWSSEEKRSGLQCLPLSIVKYSHHSYCQATEEDAAERGAGKRCAQSALHQLKKQCHGGAGTKLGWGRGTFLALPTYPICLAQAQAPCPRIHSALPFSYCVLDQASFFLL